MIDWLIENCPRKAIVRALECGKIEFLGGFRPIPPSDLPGWILMITSVYDKTWNVAVLANSVLHRYEIRIIQNIPWGNWVGTDDFYNDRFRIPLFSGDHPGKYKEKRDGHTRFNT